MTHSWPNPFSSPDQKAILSPSGDQTAAAKAIKPFPGSRIPSFAPHTAPELESPRIAPISSESTRTSIVLTPSPERRPTPGISCGANRRPLRAVVGRRLSSARRTDAREDRGGGAINVGLGRRSVGDRDARSGTAAPSGAAKPAGAVGLDAMDHLAGEGVSVPRGQPEASEHLIQHHYVENRDPFSDT